MITKLSTLITLIIGIASIASLLIGLATWYAGAVKKTYAAERNFNHLQNDLKQLSGSMAVILDDAKERFDQIDHTLEKIQQSIDQLSEGCDQIHHKGFFR